MKLDALLQWVFSLAAAVAMRENEFLFPWIESLHVLSITLVFGTIAMVDLRICGLAFNEQRVSRLINQLLPCTWGAFAIAALTGGLLFISNAFSYAHNLYFQIKILCLILAGLNMLFFHFVAGRDISRWESTSTPWPARLAGVVSLVIWVTVIATGRWIGFTLQPHLIG